MDLCRRVVPLVEVALCLDAAIFVPVYAYSWSTSMTGSTLAFLLDQDWIRGDLEALSPHLEE